MSRTSFNQLTGGLQVLRTALEQSFARRQSLHRFLEWAKGQPRLHDCRVGDAMSKPVVTLPVTLTLSEALSRSRETSLDAFPIVDESDHLVGICTRSNFYQAVLQLRPPQTPMKEIMDQPVITIGESESLGNAQAMFLREPIKRLVVVADADPTRVVGLLTPFDMLSFLAEDSAELFSGIASS